MDHTRFRIGDVCALLDGLAPDSYELEMNDGSMNITLKAATGTIVLQPASTSGASGERGEITSEKPNRRPSSGVNHTDTALSGHDRQPSDVARQQETPQLSLPKRKKVARPVNTLDESSKRSKSTTMSPASVTISTPDLVEKSRICLSSLPAESERGFPVGRWGHSLVVVSDRRAILYGGESEVLEAAADVANRESTPSVLGDLFFLDLQGHKWSKPLHCENIPRAWHSATLIPEQSLMVVFGGEQIIQGKREVVDDMMVLDTTLDLWYKPSWTGRAPSARSGHSASLVGNNMVVFGGNKGRKWQSTVFVLDTPSWNWTSPAVAGIAPPGRSYHSATVVGNMLVIFGGNDGDRCYNSVTTLQHVNDQWRWGHPDVKGCAPLPRTGHTAVLLSDNRHIQISNGWDPQDVTEVYYNDTFWLDTQEWLWKPAPSTLQIRAVPTTIDDHEFSIPTSSATAGRTGHRGVRTRVDGQDVVISVGGQADDGSRSVDVVAYTFL